MIKTSTKYRIPKNFLKRISIDPEICHGTPCIKGHRIMVYQIIDMIADGASFAEIIGEYPGIIREDIVACLEYANYLIRNEEVRIVRR